MSGEVLSIWYLKQLSNNLCSYFLIILLYIDRSTDFFVDQFI